MKRGMKILLGALMVMISYAGCFVLLWVQTRSPDAPKTSLSANDMAVLEDSEVILTHYMDSTKRDASKSSEELKKLDETIQRISEHAGSNDWYGSAGNAILSDAQLVRNDRRQLERAQQLLMGLLKLCNLVTNGLRERVNRRDVMNTTRDIEEWVPKAEEVIEQTDRDITKTKLGLAIDPNTLSTPARYEWNMLALINLEQQSELSSLKAIQMDVAKSAGSLKKLAERTHVTYKTFRFPF